jgi:membrane protein DedA with SNARE-associated domain
VFILLGALAGGTLMFCLGQRSPERAEALVLYVPFVSPAMFDKTHQDFERNGIPAIVHISFWILGYA